MKNACAGALAAALFGAAPALADGDLVRVEFQEKAPTDSFLITNAASCPEGVVIRTVSIDLRPAEGNLIFDTERGGAGYLAAEGIEVIRGEENVASVNAVTDGDQVLTLDLAGMVPGDRVRVAIGVDDVSRDVEGPTDDVSARELEGATTAVKLVEADGQLKSSVGIFNNIGVATVPWDACPVSPVVEDDEAAEILYDNDGATDDESPSEPREEVLEERLGVGETPVPPEF